MSDILESSAVITVKKTFNQFTNFYNFQSFAKKLIGNIRKKHEVLPQGRGLLGACVCVCSCVCVCVRVHVKNQFDLNHSQPALVDGATSHMIFLSY